MNFIFLRLLFLRNYLHNFWHLLHFYSKIHSILLKKYAYDKTNSTKKSSKSHDCKSPWNFRQHESEYQSKTQNTNAYKQQKERECQTMIIFFHSLCHIIFSIGFSHHFPILSSSSSQKKKEIKSMKKEKISKNLRCHKKHKHWKHVLFREEPDNNNRKTRTEIITKSFINVFKHTKRRNKLFLIHSNAIWNLKAHKTNSKENILVSFSFYSKTGKKIGISICKTSSSSKKI